MNLAEKFKEESLKVQDENKKVIEEIVDYFKVIFESGKFENSLLNNLSAEIKNKRKMNILVEFWAYLPGCSSTYFSIYRFRWENPKIFRGKENIYKGVDLRSIQTQVGEKLLKLTTFYLTKMGFHYTISNEETWLKYFKKQITIDW